MSDNNNVVPLRRKPPKAPDPSAMFCPRCTSLVEWTTWERNEMHCRQCGWTGLFSTCTDISR